MRWMRKTTAAAYANVLRLGGIEVATVRFDHHRSNLAVDRWSWECDLPQARERGHAATEQDAVDMVERLVKRWLMAALLKDDDA